MSDFRVFLLAAALIVAVYTVMSRRRKARAAAPSEEAESTEQCPFCTAEIEPGFLECWNCRGKFENAKKAPDKTKES